ncbi:beta-lactamase-like protein [Dactylonectria macrodidyma]|uniref:Beta-lactamase-like protein n=1 Tax=Dactylonectria macrodidyma TaxID=307937 RepID=A0A9P9IG15_9HYPO|nr:beta-lactamase-like protein [Dactylonectria macrodidyma]
MADITPIPAPYLDLPASSKTVRVRAIDTTTRMVCDARAFVQPPIAGHEKLNFKTMCFLLEHTAASGSEHVLFDCGSRKDFWNGSPQTKRMIGGHVPAVQIDKGVDEILTSAGLHLEDLKAIVWSHWHWDHIGDGSKFPSATDIVVGPGFTAEFVPGWPERLESFVLASDLAGHRVHEPEFDMTVAGFPAHDYFGNGSFYLLEVPGHALGHICGFARTTPDTFVFMGGDCCHYAGAFRPTPYLPLPLHIPTDELDAYYPRPCPCSMFTVHHPTPKKDGNNALNQSRTKPFYDISQAPGSAYSFGDVAQSSVNMLQALDAHPGIFICLSHDDVLFNILPLLNEEPTRDINDWQSLGYKERSRWAFLNELPKGDNPGREPLVTGLWRDGRQVTWRADSGFVDVEK